MVEVGNVAEVTLTCAVETDSVCPWFILVAKVFVLIDDSRLSGCGSKDAVVGKVCNVIPLL